MFVKNGVFRTAFLHLTEMLDSWYNYMLFNLLTDRQSIRQNDALHKCTITSDTIIEMDTLKFSDYHCLTSCNS